MSRSDGLWGRLGGRGCRRGAVAGRTLAAALVFTPAVAFGVVGGGASAQDVGAAAVRTYFSTQPGIEIRDASTAIPYPSTTEVSGLTGTIVDVNLELPNFNHTNPDDVDVLLVAPRGQAVIVLSDVGGSENIINTDVTIDDQAPTEAPDATRLESGNYQPTDNEPGETFPNPAPSPSGTELAEFNDENPNGTWQLFVDDDTADGSGSFAGRWSLTITTSNTGPRANDDQYTATAGETLRVRVPGVLRNDRDPDNDRLTVRRVRATRQGTVRLESNGSFTYNPKDDAKGQDTFVYEVKDSNGLTDRAVVTIEIKRARDNDRD